MLEKQPLMNWISGSPKFWSKCVCVRVWVIPSNTGFATGRQLPCDSRGHRPILDTCANEAIPQWGKRSLITCVYLLKEFSCCQSCSNTVFPSIQPILPFIHWASPSTLLAWHGTIHWLDLDHWLGFHFVYFSFMHFLSQSPTWASVYTSPHTTTTSHTSTTTSCWLPFSGLVYNFSKA